MIQVLDETMTEADFLVSGETLILLSSHSGGTWALSIIAPDGTAISTGIAFDGNGQQRVVTPSNTQLRLSGGSAGAKAWTNEIIRRYTERIA